MSMTPLVVCASHFTGKERDTESGLDYFGARYFGSAMGRFMSPDPVGGHLEDPQTLNRYIYVRNNPLNLTDPTGLDFYISCQKESDSCQKQTVGYDKHGEAQKALVQGTTDKDGFKATQIGDDGKGGLVDKTTNTGAYTANVGQSGVSFSQDGGKTSSSGVFVNGTDPTHIQGSGDFAGFSFTFTNSKLEAGQTAAGTFTFGGTLTQARETFMRLGFQYWPIGQHWGSDEYRSRGEPNTGANSAHFDLHRINLEPRNGVPQVGGDMHFGEHNPMFSPRIHAHEVER